jgi:hypothetical protein
MKMGTIVSPRRYDVAAGETIRPNSQRRTSILRYASWVAVFPIPLAVWLPSIAALSISGGIDVMGHKLSVFSDFGPN